MSMFKVMAMLQTNGGSSTRVVGEFGGDDALQTATDWCAYWSAQPGCLLAWIA